eukprot:GGOE01058634.1.p1 GENE.GGOE01058634.1~~GGOE01058634.1.p1  ORF type:complete len:527 (-),score=105.35 GGOE01058634.1:43-1623(-)
MRQPVRCSIVSLLVGVLTLPILSLLLFGNPEKSDGAAERPRFAQDLPATVPLRTSFSMARTAGATTPAGRPHEVDQIGRVVASPVTTGGPDSWLASIPCEARSVQPMSNGPDELWAAGRSILPESLPESRAAKTAPPDQHWKQNQHCFQQYRYCTSAGAPLPGQCGQCTCEPGRTGPTCASFRWGKQQTAHDGLAVDGVNTWGGSTMMDDKGLFHMMVAKFVNGSVNNWYQTSVIVHAISEYPTGPYRIVGDALLGSGDPDTFDATVTHNPHLARLRDGQFLLFYIGMNCIRHPGAACEREQAIGVATAPSLWGPWKRLGRPILTPNPCRHEERTSSHGVVANPSVVLSSDDRVLLFYRGVNDDAVMLATADRWDGPYRRLGMGGIVRLRGMRVEDMYVWPTASGGCNMLVHVQSLKLTHITRNLVSALFYSPVCNASSYQYWHIVQAEPYSRCVEVEGQGRHACFNRRERPQLLFRNHSPIAMCTAVDEATKTSGGTRHRQFTLCSSIALQPESLSNRTPANTSL